MKDCNNLNHTIFNSKIKKIKSIKFSIFSIKWLFYIYFFNIPIESIVKLRLALVSSLKFFCTDAF